MLNPKATLLLALYGLRTAFVAATPVTVTVTTTVTECAASCFTTMNVCTNTKANDNYTSASPVSTSIQDLPPAYTREQPSETSNWPPEHSLPVSLPLISTPNLPTTSSPAPGSSDYGIPTVILSTTGEYLYPYPSVSYGSSVDAIETTAYETSVPTTFITNTREYSSVDEYPRSSTTDEGPPAHGTPTDGPPSYDEPPSYSEPPSYGGSR